MSTEISPENEHYVESAIANGQYRDRAQVLNEALRLLRERERHLADLRKDIEDGIHSGPPVPGEQVFKRLEERAQQIAERAGGK